MISSIVIFALTSALLASGPPADTGPFPRVAIEAACTAAAPQAGEVFSGPVLQVIDGQTLCVAEGPTPDRWVRVRLSDVGERNPRGALMAAVFAKDVICTTDRRLGAGVAARCAYDGSPVGELVRSSEVMAQAAAWR